MKSKSHILNRIKDSLHTHLPKDGEAFLYGSQARGDAHPGSDWDVLILLNKANLEMNDYDTVSYPLTVLGIELGETISPMLYTKEEWQQCSFSPFYKNVQKDGIRL